MNSKIILCIPTYNPGNEFAEVLKLINNDSSLLTDKVIIDSGSTDGTLNLAYSAGFKIIEISKEQFGHAKTRTFVANKYSNYDYIIFLTQDVFIQDNSLTELVKFITANKDIGVAYGKQEVDIVKGNIFEHFDRSFNYPDENLLKNNLNSKEYGVKTVFNSNAFSIYNMSILKDVNFFGTEAPFSEDTLVAYKIVNKGYSIGYCSEAVVYHTHKYSLKNQYLRYKSAGEFHKLFPEIQNQYGKNESEGFKLIINEFRYLFKEKKLFLSPYTILRNAAKYLGYKTGGR